MLTHSELVAAHRVIADHITECLDWAQYKLTPLTRRAARQEANKLAPVARELKRQIVEANRRQTIMQEIEMLRDRITALQVSLGER